MILAKKLRKEARHRIHTAYVFPTEATEELKVEILPSFLPCVQFSINLTYLYRGFSLSQEYPIRMFCIFYVVRVESDAHIIYVCTIKLAIGSYKC